MGELGLVTTEDNAKHKSKNPRGKNTYMYMKELKELERKKNCLMDFIIYLWNLKYWFLEPQDL